MIENYDIQNLGRDGGTKFIDFPTVCYIVLPSMFPL